MIQFYFRELCSDLKKKQQLCQVVHVVGQGSCKRMMQGSQPWRVCFQPGNWFGKAVNATKDNEMHCRMLRHGCKANQHGRRQGFSSSLADEWTYVSVRMCQHLTEQIYNSHVAWDAGSCDEIYRRNNQTCYHHWWLDLTQERCICNNYCALCGPNPWVAVPGA